MYAFAYNKNSIKNLVILNYHLTESIIYGNAFFNTYFILYKKKTTYINLYTILFLFYKYLPLVQYFIKINGYFFFVTTLMEVLSVSYNFSSNSLQAAFIGIWKPGVFLNSHRFKYNVIRSDRSLRLITNNSIFFIFNSVYSENLYKEILSFQPQMPLIVVGGPTIPIVKNMYYFPGNSTYYTCFFLYNLLTFYIKNLFLIQQNRIFAIYIEHQKRKSLKRLFKR